MYGLFVYQDKKGRCRDVAVVQRWQLVEVQLTFFSEKRTWLCAYLDPVPLVIARKGLEIIPSLKFSFFPRTITEWNKLPEGTVSSQSLCIFKSKLI